MDTPQKKRVSKLAIASLILGVLCLTPFLGVLFWIPALFVALIAIIITSRRKAPVKGRWLAILAISLSILSFVGCFLSLKMFLGPSTQELTARFAKNRNDFETLRVMFQEDKNVNTVDREGAALFDRDKPGISVQRQEEYARLLDKLNLIALWTWKSAEHNEKTAIAFFAHRGGSAVSGNAKFYLWFSYKPTESDTNRMDGIDVVSFTPIDEGWYLLHESN